ncbi:DHA2 family efflux MFS transporter permease subunit [Streptomyces odontomachi]|uniref:DHA2 family efflux MFS transporter permease subunit n=1 Tax=Streptomyces odontomachi TaxID=2944940 RepID=UPI00272E8D5D|nr:DHA2 family efflux MFS transporter permease subunit [Streptomyces sp. ODS25]
MARTVQSRQAQAALPPVPWQVWRLAIVVVLGSFMSTLDSSLVNVGLDTISRSLRASLTSAQWLSSGYVVAFAAALPLNAWLSRRIGSGRLWLTALVGFVAASALCAAAPNLPALIAFRVVQGLTGALLVPTGQTIIGQVAGRERMGRVLNITKIVVILAPAIGPTIGGLLISGLSWRWLFLVNVPVGAVAVLAGLRLVPRGTPARGRRFDALGFTLVAAGLPLVLYGITRLGRAGSLADPAVPATLAPGLAALALFVWRSLTIAHPLLDLRLFANRVYSAATASVFFTGAALLGTLILLPLYYQQLRGQSVIDTGLLMLAVGGGTAVSMPFGGMLTDRIGGGLISMAGLALSAAGILPLAFLPADTGLVLAGTLQAVTGFGLGLAAMPALSVAYKTVPRDRLPDATSEANIIQRVGGSTGTALLVVLLERDGTPTVGAFHTAFGWLVATCVIALLLAAWLTIEEAHRRHGRTDEAP